MHGHCSIRPAFIQTVLLRQIFPILNFSRLAHWKRLSSFPDEKELRCGLLILYEVVSLQIRKR
jgi:hypothetical protein